MRISDWSSDVCSSDLAAAGSAQLVRGYWVKAGAVIIDVGINRIEGENGKSRIVGDVAATEIDHAAAYTPVPGGVGPMTIACLRSEEHTSELQSLMRISYAVFCLNNKMRTSYISNTDKHSTQTVLQRHNAHCI